MIDAGMVTGALIFLAGTGFGGAVRSLPARRRPDPAPVCQCGHPRALHDPTTNECHQQVRVPGTASRMSHHRQCGCRQYVGPEPMPSLFANRLELPEQ